ncbi:HD domain-containing protein [Streptomyces sp. NPDC002851]
MGEPKYKALLIGAANYGAPGITPLPFIPDDLERMSAALVARGFHQAAVAQLPLVTPNEVNGEVTQFLGEAERGDRLLIVLSGHGVHHRGKDYLVPEDIRTELLTFAKGCIEIDWRDEIEESRAEQVVFLIDACREGIERDTKSTSGWSRRKTELARDRKVAYVYACSPGEYARFVRTEDASFSLFSEAVTDLLQDRTATGTGTLGTFRTAAQERIDTLHTEHAKPGRPQRIRALTETPEDEFTLLPPDGRSGDRTSDTERTWVEAAASHPAWQFTAPELSATVEQVRQVCGALVSRYARTCDQLSDVMSEDPWHDAELAHRTTDRLGFLLRRLAPGTVLSPTEAAHLVLLPFAAQAHWARQAAERQPPEAELDEFLGQFPRLKRRIRTLPWQSEALRQIRWWAYHRWLIQDPAVFAATVASDEDVPSDSDWTRSELAEHRLLRYLKEQRVAPVSAPGTARITALEDRREVAPSTADEHTVRERLVSALLKAAHALAIDPADLPEVLVEHLGISDSVDLDALFATVRKSQWHPSGVGRSLRAECEHPAVLAALKEHAEDVDALLRELNHLASTDGPLAPLSPLPAYADARDVRLTSAAPANLSAGIRFRLDEERIQELLMGEQLYGERGLAIRELYQNALDACRYRAARTEYLHRTGHRTAAWEGEITFTEGVDDSGRAYLECADNGVGMGVTELTGAFSRGGARFVDLPEYIEEGGLWASLDPPVTLDPVSRFGIGVLSYFMIADEITVWTCRLGRDGRPGPLLKVTIAGPGNLFRVEDLGQGTESGTRVRLYAAPGRDVPSPDEVLRRRLMVAPYRVIARGGGEERVWEPGVLAADRTVPPQPSRGNDVWWVPYGGQLLVDGIVGANSHNVLRDRPTGRVVNLHGGEARLSVDRQRIIEYDQDAVRAKCMAAVDDLMGRPDLLTHTWLLDLYEDDTILADEVLARAMELRLSWDTGNGTLHASRTGLFPLDLELLPVVTGIHSAQEYDNKATALLLLTLPEPLVRWRLRALLGLPTGMPPTGTPVDLRLFVVNARLTVKSWRAAFQYASGRYERTRVDFGPIDKDWDPGILPPLDDDDDLSFELNAVRDLIPWRQGDEPLQAEEVLATAYALRLPVSEVTDRLRDLGYRIAPLGALAQAAPGDLPLLRVERPDTWNVHAEWLPPGGVVHLAHLLGLERPDKTSVRLAELGYVLPDSLEEQLPNWPEFNDSRHHVSVALMAHPDALPASPSDASRITRSQLICAADVLGATPRELARRLALLGFTVPDDAPAAVPAAHRTVNRAGLTSTWSRTIAASEVERLLHRAFTDLTVTDARSALAELGFSVSDAPGAAFPGLNRFMAPGAPDHRHTEAIVTPTCLRVAATLADVPESRLRAGLREAGVRIPEATDPAHDELLARHLSPTTRDEAPGVHPGAPDVPPGTPLRLAELASAALATGRTFREVAEAATELGFKHEAENWFNDA